MLLGIPRNVFQRAAFAWHSDATCAARTEGGRVILQVSRGQSNEESKTKV